VTWNFVNFWTEVQSLYLAINEVSSVIQNKAYGAKNKVFKLQGGQRYLTLITNIHALIYITYIYIYKRANESSKLLRVMFMNFNRVEPSLYGYVLFNNLA
jgi:hypothetical protein